MLSIPPQRLDVSWVRVLTDPIALAVHSGAENGDRATRFDVQFSSSGDGSVQYSPALLGWMRPLPASTGAVALLFINQGDDGVIVDIRTCGRHR